MSGTTKECKDLSSSVTEIKRGSARQTNRVKLKNVRVLFLPVRNTDCLVYQMENGVEDEHVESAIFNMVDFIIKNKTFEEFRISEEIEQYNDYVDFIRDCFIVVKNFFSMRGYRNDAIFAASPKWIIFANKKSIQENARSLF